MSCDFAIGGDGRFVVGDLFGFMQPGTLVTLIDKAEGGGTRFTIQFDARPTPGTIVGGRDAMIREILEAGR